VLLPEPEGAEMMKRIPAIMLSFGQFSVLSSQFSVLSSQFSVLSSQFSVLRRIIGNIGGKSRKFSVGQIGSPAQIKN
jgi:hypothetical protein